MKKQSNNQSETEQLRQELAAVTGTRDGLRESLTEFKEIQQLSETIRAAVEPDNVVTALFGVIAHLLDYQTCAVYLLAEGEEPVCFGNPEQKLAAAVPDLISDGIIDWVQGEKRPVLVPDIDLPPGEIEDPGQQLSYLVVPLAVGGRGIGFFICFTAAARDTITQQRLDTIFFTVNQAAVALQNSLLYQEIARTRTFLDSIITQAQEAVIVLDLDGTIEFANPAINTLGWQSDKFLRRDFLNLLPVEEEQQQLSKLLDSRQPGRLNITLLNDRDQRLDTDISVTPLRDELGQTLLLVRDITETRRLQQKAIFEEKFRALTEAAVAVNHEVNNPLTTIKGQLYLLLNEKDSPLRDQDRKRLQSILENSTRIAEVIQRFEQVENLDSVQYLDGLQMLNLRPDGEDDNRELPPEE
ncbi:MAG: PAS domain-containing protein [Candidatus Delongbacteria bacterium]|nr:PAS domain-containing protein [Candidatus Delongbacteria bacterium]